MNKILVIILTIVCVQAQSQVKDADNLYLLELLQNQRYIESSDYLKKIYQEPITDKKILSLVTALKWLADYQKPKPITNEFLKKIQQKSLHFSVSQG